MRGVYAIIMLTIGAYLWSGESKEVAGCTLTIATCFWGFFIALVKAKLWD